MNKEKLSARLKDANPGWEIWDALIKLVEESDFEFVQNEFLGDFLESGDRLSFGNPQRINWPTWIPSYVPALYGMKANVHDMAGGFADNFDGSKTEKGFVFFGSAPDSLLDYPEFDIADDIYKFQSNISGALFHISEELEVFAPNSDEERLVVMDSLENFTKRNIEQVIAGGHWFKEYESRLEGTFLD